MNNEEVINELKKFLVYNEYRDVYVIRGENLPFLAEGLIMIFAGKIQENCDHDFGGVEWYTACQGSKKCRKCGYEQDVYERD